MDASRAAIMIPSTSVAGMADLLTRVLSQRRYEARAEVLPPQSMTYAGEWLAYRLHELTGTGLAGSRLGLIVPDDRAHLFTDALWIAEAEPGLSFLAWQQMKGMQPVLKYYAQGRPQWRSGNDPDHEVTWAIPTSLPVDIQPPETHQLPTNAAEFETSGGYLLAPFAHPIACEPCPRLMYFLDRRSPLHDLF